eukprot:3564137-Pleurochrysis_carterae.AAC.1
MERALPEASRAAQQVSGRPKGAVAINQLFLPGICHVYRSWRGLWPSLAPAHAAGQWEPTCPRRHST